MHRRDVRRKAAHWHQPILPPGVGRVPYHPSYGTRGYHPRVHQPAPALTMAARVHPGTRASGQEQGPGLRALFRRAAMLSTRTASPSLFPYLRLIEPGRPDRHQAIRVKCWIGSRSRAAWAALAGRAWRVPGGLPRASWEALGPWIRPSGTPDLAIPDPGIRASGTRIPGIRAARIPGNLGSWQLLTEV